MLFLEEVTNEGNNKIAFLKKNKNKWFDFNNHIVTIFKVDKNCGDDYTIGDLREFGTFKINKQLTDNFEFSKFHQYLIVMERISNFCYHTPEEIENSEKLINLEIYNKLIFTALVYDFKTKEIKELDIKKCGFLDFKKFQIITIITNYPQRLLECISSNFKSGGIERTTLTWRRLFE